jgi:ABC-type multidrug transport system ATPase subunit
LEIVHIRDVVVGDEKRRGISGGERKRVNIAMELVTKPSLLCLDEPTSGLDSTTAATVVHTLKDIADAGANVITVLHQVSQQIINCNLQSPHATQDSCLKTLVSSTNQP